MTRLKSRDHASVYMFDRGDVKDDWRGLWHQVLHLPSLFPLHQIDVSVIEVAVISISKRLG